MITVPRMKVKVLPSKVKTDSQSVPTEVYHQSEAGNRAQSEPKQIGALVLMGR
jgi:hypothetical protein